MFSWMYMWWFWLALSLVFLLPVGYGWGYRGWGAPYPRYIQQRRMQRATDSGSLSAFDHQAWGRGGDLIWTLVAFELALFMMLLWWR